MEVVRAREREREQGGREARRSLEVAAIALHSGGIEGAWVAAGREGGKEGGAACWWRGIKCRRMCERQERQQDEREEWR